MDEEEWPKWTAQRGTALTLDGTPLVEIFKKIQAQLEILRNRPIFDPKRMVIPSQFQPKPAPASVAPSSTTAPPPAAVSNPQYPMQQPGIAPDVFEEKMAALEKRILDLESKEQVVPEPVDISPVQEKLDELTRRFDDSTADIYISIHNLEQRCTNQENDLQHKVFRGCSLSIILCLAYEFCFLCSVLW